jgi:anthranilate synthase/aminodeoxychorismate synthase-like glutamine amidotransferase
MNARIVFVDNRDSFTFNLVDELRLLGCTVEVWRADRAPAFLLGRAGDDGVLVLSPGPGRPDEAGCCVPLVREATARRVPVLGVCLGHQAIVVACGGAVGPAPGPVHGRASPVRHAGHALFAGVATPFAAGRYHSLCATALPPSLAAIAHGDDGTVMAVDGTHAPLIGLQFHPESILTPEGPRMLANALTLLRSARARAAA